MHVTELRAAINGLRAGYGFAAFTFTDPTLTSTSTLIRTAHVTELRAALTPIYQAAGKLPPTYTDPSLDLQQSLIKASHLSELRTAVRAAQQFSPPLTVVFAGTGGGTVASPALGIACTHTCVNPFSVKTVVTLTATPTSSSSFSGWNGGGCTGTEVCTVVMTAATSVTATFAVNSKAALTSPIPGSVLPGASATFTWSAGSGAAEYFLRVGTTLGGADLYGVSQGLNLSATVTTLPGGSVPIFVRLQTRFGTTWQSTDYTFTGGVLRPGRTHQSHPGEHLQRGSDHIQLERRGRSHGIHRLGGTAPGGQDLYNQSLGLNQFAFVNNLPGGAAPVFARLITRFGTSEQFTDYTFTGAPFCF